MPSPAGPGQSEEARVSAWVVVAEGGGPGGKVLKCKGLVFPL